jgi:hypothetical protein
MPGTVLLFINMKIHGFHLGCQQEPRKVPNWSWSAQASAHLARGAENKSNNKPIDRKALTIAGILRDNLQNI